MTPKAVSKKRGDRKGTALGMAAGLGWKEPRWDSEGVGPEDRGEQPEDPEPSGRGAEGRLQSYLAGRTERTDILGIPAVFQAYAGSGPPAGGETQIRIRLRFCLEEAQWSGETGECDALYQKQTCYVDRHVQVALVEPRGEWTWGWLEKDAHLS